MKKHNIFWAIVGIICFLFMLALSLCLAGQYYKMEQNLIAAHAEYNNKIQILEQNCESIMTQNSTLEDQLKICTEQLNEKDKIIDASNIMIEALKSNKYSIPYTVTEKEIDMIAQTIWGEARGLNTFEQSLVVWCILNRVDDGTWGNTIMEVITARSQFHGYSSTHPITEEHRALARDVVTRWQMERFCSGNVGRTLPKEYLYFHSSSGHNVYKTNYKHPYQAYDWSSCWNPYK